MVISAVAQETADTWTLTIDPGEPFAFAPGQFNMVYAFGVGEVPISISGDPTRPDELVHTIRAVGATTRAICALQPGQTLGIRGPFGSAWPVEAAQGGDLVVVAGGVGLAPLRPVVYHVLANREAYGRVALLYGARTPKDLLFQQELLTWRSRFDMQVYVTVDSDVAESAWRGDVGVVPALIPRARFDPAKTTGMVCGPEIMMRFAAQGLGDDEVPLEQVYVSAERNMQCGVGHCGHCQYGPDFVCKEGPVYPYPRIAGRMRVREL
jgi:NAD(P)H-flavin reductase